MPLWLYESSLAPVEWPLEPRRSGAGRRGGNGWVHCPTVGKSQSRLNAASKRRDRATSSDAGVYSAAAHSTRRLYGARGPASVQRRLTDAARPPTRAPPSGNAPHVPLSCAVGGSCAAKNQLDNVTWTVVLLIDDYGGGWRRRTVRRPYSADYAQATNLPRSESIEPTVAIGVARRV